MSELDSDIIYECIFEIVTLILGMGFFFVDTPSLAIIREEGISLVRGVVDLCQTETIRQADGLLIDTSTTNDIDVLVGLATLQCCLKGRVDVAPRQFLGGLRQYYITAIG